MFLSHFYKKVIQNGYSGITCKKQKQHKSTLLFMQRAKVSFHLYIYKNKIGGGGNQSINI